MSRLPRQISPEIVKFVFICTILGSFLSWTPNYYNSLLISRNDKNSQQFWMLSHQTAANFLFIKSRKSLSLFSWRSPCMRGFEICGLHFLRE